MHTLLLSCAKYLIVIVGLIALGYWLTLPKKLKIRMLVYGMVTAVVAYAFTEVGRMLFYDTRPFVADHLQPLYAHAADNGFPSDHTLLAAVIAVIVYAFSKKIGVVLMGMALVVGISRVAGHIHRPIDIIGSIIFALTGGVAAHYLTPRILERFTSTASTKH